MEERRTTMDRLTGSRCAGLMTELLDTLRAPILLAATVATGLQAGTYYTWASGVMPGLAKVDEVEEKTFGDIHGRAFEGVSPEERNALLGTLEKVATNLGWQPV